MYCRDDNKEGQRQGMVVYLSRRDIGDHGAVVDKVVCEEVAGKLVEYVAGTTIKKVCTGAERMEGSSQLLRWWYQHHGPNHTAREVD